MNRINIFKSTVGKYYLLCSIIPVLLLSIVLTSVSSGIIRSQKSDDTEKLLQASANELIYSYNIYADGDFVFNKIDDEYYLGDVKLTGDYSIVDAIKNDNDVDVSLFCEDNRIITTIKVDGRRYISSKSSDIWADYVSKGEVYFNEKCEIGGKEYYGYYKPVIDKDENIIGMAFAGVPSSEIKESIIKLQIITILISAIFCLTLILTAIYFSGKLLTIQNKALAYLGEIDKGDFSHKMEEKMLNRKDEYGAMSRYFVKLNDSLSNSVQTDSLTGLYNRRATMKRLERFVKSANSSDKVPFSLAIGDIDFFKKVNDTYGHACGDDVLKMVADVLLNSICEDIIVGRWGGEEFLVAIKGSVDDAMPRLEEIFEKIKAGVVVCDGTPISITMTFGISEYIAPQKLDTVISNADRLLYKGKESGRNRIVR